MSSRAESISTYVSILIALLLLTFLTVGLSFFELPQPLHVAAGLTIAAVKASLVILFFMHAIESPRVTWCVIVASVVWLVILFGLTLADYLTRSMVPFAPGHLSGTTSCPNTIQNRKRLIFDDTPAAPGNKPA